VDGVRQRSCGDVLFGGIATGPGNPSNTPLADTWEWDEHVWRQREDMGPSPRLGAALAYDQARKKLVLFGGQAKESFGDTWELGEYL
jgi:hypothetical protein